MKRLAIALCIVGMFVAGLSGCGKGGPKPEPTVHVTGKVLYQGKPLPVDANPKQLDATRLSLTFLRINEDKPGISKSTHVKQDGSFEIDIPVGKYRIAVTYGPVVNGPDPVGDKFTEEDSPIVKEINGECNIEIELSQY